MTREEQIQQAEINYSDDTIFDGCDYIGQVAKQEAFIAGAKWADENPKDGMVSLDKVEKYLRENIIFYVWTTDLDKREEWFHKFCNAMKK